MSNVRHGLSEGASGEKRCHAILLKAQEENAQRLMMVYAITGLFFMLLPGTFLGVWNLISISGARGAAISASWIQAHGHAQIFGWIGTFILGIGFYSIPKMTSSAVQTHPRGPGLRGCSGLQASSALGLRLSTISIGACCCRFQLCLSFAAFSFSLSRSKAIVQPVRKDNPPKRMPVWIIAVLVGTVGFGMALLMNLLAASVVSLRDTGPDLPIDR